MMYAGNILVSPSSSSSSSTTSPSKALPRTPVRNENIFRPTKKTYFDTIANVALGPSTPPAIVTASSTAIAQSASTLVARVPVPAIFQSSASILEALSATPVPVTLPKGDEVAPVEERVVKWIPVSLRGKFYARLFGKRAQVTIGAHIGRRSEVVWAIQGSFPSPARCVPSSMYCQLTKRGG